MAGVYPWSHKSWWEVEKIKTPPKKNSSWQNQVHFLKIFLDLKWYWNVFQTFGIMLILNSKLQYSSWEVRNWPHPAQEIFHKIRRDWKWIRCSLFYGIFQNGAGPTVRAVMEKLIDYSPVIIEFVGDKLHPITL